MSEPREPDPRFGTSDRSDADVPAAGGGGPESMPADLAPAEPVPAEPARSALDRDGTGAPEPAQPEDPSSGKPLPDGEVPWHRLSSLTMAVTAAWVAAIALFSALAATISGLNPLYTFPFVPIVIIAAVALDYVHWTRAEYRLTAERLELRSGILIRSHKSAPRDRIRSVDLSADVIYRIFGVTKIAVGTGQQATASDSAEIKLDPLPVAQGEWLRTELLRRESGASAAGSAAAPAVEAPSEVSGGSQTHSVGTLPPAYASGTAPIAGPTGAPEQVGPVELARLDWAWLKYAPVGVLTPILGSAAIGGLFQVGDWFNTLPWKVGWFQPVVDPFRDVPLLVVLVVAAVSFLVVGAIGATAIWIESWWDYRLEREGGVFRVRRGLLTSRSISLEEARLRGIELIEPLPLRRLGAGSTNAVATGMESKSDQEKGADKKALIPPAPLPIVERVAASVLDEPTAPTIGAPLIGHPRVACRRRLVWALAAVTLPLVVLVILGALLTDVLLWIALPFAIVGYAAATLFALDAYRNLGHGLTAGYLLARHGTAARRTVALRRNGIIGWKIEQTFFQRRVGIATVTATTAAGGGQYSAYDVELGEGLRFAEDAVPELLTPFLTTETPTPTAESSGPANPVGTASTASRPGSGEPNRATPNA